MRPLPDFHPIRKRQRGAALLIILTIIGIGVAVLLVNALTRAANRIEADKKTAAALAQAKDALIGYAATYRDSHANEVFGYLPLPDLGSSRNGTAEEGNAAGNFSGNTKNLTVIGRLPWRTLGLPPLRDGQGECLWYAVSGSFQDTQKADVLNWDSLGHLDLYTSDGTPAGTVSTTGNNYGQRPVAIIFSAGPPVPGQNRQASTTDAVGNCGGNYDVRNYLDSFNASANINNIVNYFAGTPNNSTGYAYNLTGTSNGSQLATSDLGAPKNTVFGDVSASTQPIANDRVVVITADDVFRRIKQRSDFKSDIDTMMGDLAACLNAMAAASLPAASAGNKGIDNVVTACPPAGTKKTNVLNNWKENLLYTKLPTPAKITINGALTPNACYAVLIFGGEKPGSQVRNSSTDKANSYNYLEGDNYTSFTTPGTTYSGKSAFDKTNPSQDLLACITGTSPGTTQVTFASNFGSFVTAGAGVTPDSTTQTLSIATAAGGSGGCFWYPTAIPLNGKTLRAYYEFKFTNSDTGSDKRGYGITLSLLRGDVGAPTTCGSRGDMGVLDLSTTWGSASLFVETDVHQTSPDNDPTGNHTAIMANGNLYHSSVASGNGYVTSACNGTAQGCLHSPANKFEESPAPLTHNQRVEIHTGYNSTCTATGGSYAQIKAWVDCILCSDTSADFLLPPTISRCIALDPALNTFYFGLTGGFTSGGNAQGVTIQNLDLRTQ